MKELIKNNEQAVRKHTKLDYDKIQTVTYLTEFDREVQCPVWGYPTESAYYRDASSSDSVLAIRIPFLALNAEDDPVGFVVFDFRTPTDPSRLPSRRPSPTKSSSRTPTPCCVRHPWVVIYAGSSLAAAAGMQSPLTTS